MHNARDNNHSKKGNRTNQNRVRGSDQGGKVRAREGPSDTCSPTYLELGATEVGPRFSFPMYGVVAAAPLATGTLIR